MLDLRPTLSDAVTLSGRSLRTSRRNVEALTTSLVLPVMLMLLFVYLFGGALQTGTRYVTYVVPGVLLLCAGFGASLTATSVGHDLSTGVTERFRSMDVSGAAIVAGHVVASTVRNLVSTTIVFGVAFAIGFRPHASLGGWLGAVGLLLLFVVAISWASAAIGVLAKTPEAANGFTFFVMFLPYASSAFVPIGTMPSWLQGFARHQPSTPMIESIRHLLLGQPAGHDPFVAIAWGLGLLVVAAAASAWLFARRGA